jgi:predicted AAA+ superfamily ATPase
MTQRSPEYLPRLVDPLLDDLLRQVSAVMVTGPRASGKTTMAARRAATVVQLSAAAQAAAFVADADAALRGLNEPVLLDEWQEVPSVFGAARRAVDADPRANRFYLTGSVRAEHEHEVWPGTGRFVRLAMYPMSVRERIGDAAAKPFLDRLVDGDDLRLPEGTPDLRGYVKLCLESGFPMPALLLSGRARQLWLSSYIDDLLTHDVTELEDPATRRRDPGRLRSYFEACALSSAGVAEHKTIHDAAGVTKKTAVAYDDLLRRLLVVDQMAAWASNRLKRLVLSPKRYLVDAALMAAALRVDEAGVLADGDILGRMLDTFVVAQLRPEVVVAASQPRLFHLRTQAGRHEIDVLVEYGGQRVVGIEIKAAAAPGADAAKHLRWLREELGDRFVRGVVLHTGPRLYEIDADIVAAPISTLWG